ncbi:MAG: YSC84-related protein [Gammaproteobacteria bacterium]
MKTHFIIIGFLVPAIAALSGCQTTGSQTTGSQAYDSSAAAQIDRDVDVALTNLYDSVPKAKELEEHATGVLVFPRMVKAAFIGGAQYGKGALRQGGATVGYYNSLAASYGLQAGVQSFGYAMFFMNEDALSYLDRSGGWEVGVGPSIVVLDHGKARALTTTTMKDDIYAFIFSQKGLMAGLGLQGTKITRINP